MSIGARDRASATYSRHSSRIPNTTFIAEPTLQRSIELRDGSFARRSTFSTVRSFVHEIVTNPVVGRSIRRHRIDCFNACDGRPLCELLRNGSGLAAAVEPGYGMAV